MNTFAKRIWALLLLAPLSMPAAFAEDDEANYSQADLDQMLAPIALYPDSVLSHVLIAATYPLEVVQAARWSREHPDLKGEEAVEAVENKGWDPSVKALVAFPEILARMDEDLDWTERLGDAFLAQEGEVMDSVQHLRKQAYDAGTLDSLEHTRVIREREVIYIEPALSHLIFIPYYDPWIVYGSWWWPSYPPYCWRYWGGRPVRYYGSSFYWGIGFHVSPVFYFSGFHWYNHHVVVLPGHRHSRSSWAHSAREVVRRSDGQRWRHDSRHRRGVEYRSERLNRDYGRERRNAIEREQRLSRQPSSVERRDQQRPAASERRSAAHRERSESRSVQRSERHDMPRSESRWESREAPRPEPSRPVSDGNRNRKAEESGTNERHERPEERGNSSDHANPRGEDRRADPPRSERNPHSRSERERGDRGGGHRSRAAER